MKVGVIVDKEKLFLGFLFGENRNILSQKAKKFKGKICGNIWSNGETGVKVIEWINVYLVKKKLTHAQNGVIVYAKINGEIKMKEQSQIVTFFKNDDTCLLYTSPSPRDRS